MFIYVITNNITGKVYIGQHSGANLQNYLQKKFYYSRTQKKGSSYLFNAMRKHPDYHDWSISPLFEGIKTREELNRLEQLLIALYDTRNPEVGYNICRGGEGFTGNHSETARKKMSAASLAWHSNPSNADDIKARNLKISIQKKEQYADCHITKVCPECGKDFSGASAWMKRIICCSHICGYKYAVKNDPEFVNIQNAKRRIVMQTSKYRDNLAKAMKIVNEKRKRDSVDSYYTQPNQCLYCGSTIEMVEGDRLSVLKKRKYCSRPCSDKRFTPN